MLVAQNSYAQKGVSIYVSLDVTDGELAAEVHHIFDHALSPEHQIVEYTIANWNFNFKSVRTRHVSCGYIQL